MNLRNPLIVLSLILIIRIAAVSIVTYDQLSEISTLPDQKKELGTIKE